MKKLDLMHYLFGVDKGHQCKECKHLESYRVGRKIVRKCKAYGESSSDATDWAGKWDACGLRNRSYSGVEVRTLAPHSTAQHHETEPPIEGQMEMGNDYED